MVHYQVYLLTMKEDGFDLEQLWTEIHWNLLSTSISLPSIFSPPFLPLKPQISFLFICWVHWNLGSQIYTSNSAGAPVRDPNPTGLQWVKAGSAVGSAGVRKAPSSSRWSLPRRAWRDFCIYWKEQRRIFQEKIWDRFFSPPSSPFSPQTAREPSRDCVCFVPQLCLTLQPHGL